MNASVMTGRIAETSPQLKARTAGVFWLLTMIIGILALSFNGGLKLATNAVAASCYAVAALLVYELLKPVNRNLSLLAACFGLMGSASDLVLYLAKLVSAARPGELQSLAMDFLALRAQIPSISSIFFGFHCLLLGYLIFRSTFLPRIVGALMATAGLSWLTLSLTNYLVPELGRFLSPYLMSAGGVGEGSLILWLLVFGVNAGRWTRQARRSGLTSSRV